MLNTLARCCFRPKRMRHSRTNRGALTGRGRRSPPSLPTLRVHSTMVGRCIHRTSSMKTTDASMRLRTVYDGGAGVVDALYRLARRGFVELRRNYVPYLERSLEAQPDYPD